MKKFLSLLVMLSVLLFVGCDHNKKNDYKEPKSDYKAPKGDGYKKKYDDHMKDHDHKKKNKKKKKHHKHEKGKHGKGKGHRHGQASEENILEVLKGLPAVDAENMTDDEGKALFDELKKGINNE